MTSQVTASEAPALLEGGPTDEELAVIPETEKNVAGINTTPTPQLPTFTSVYSWLIDFFSGHTHIARSTCTRVRHHDLIYNTAASII